MALQQARHRFYGLQQQQLCSQQLEEGAGAFWSCPRAPPAWHTYKQHSPSGPCWLAGLRALHLPRDLS